MGIWTKIKGFFKTNGPEIGIGSGLVGMWVAVGLTIPSTVKAVRKIDRIEEEEGRELTAKEKIQEALPCYIAPIAVGIAATSCTIAGTRGELARASALTAVAKLAATKLEATEEATKEVVGEKKAKDIAIEANKKMQKSFGLVEEVFDTGTGDVIFTDPYFLGPLLFTGDFQTIRAKYNDIGTRMNLDGIVGGTISVRDLVPYVYSIDLSELDPEEREYFKALDYLEFDISKSGLPLIDEETDEKVDELGRIIHRIRHLNDPTVIAYRY